MKGLRAAALQIRTGGVDGPYVRELLSSVAPVNLAVLPELCHLPYFPLEEASDWRHRAISLDDDFVYEIQAIARENDCYIVLPIFLQDRAGMFNAAVLIGPDGSIVPGRNVMTGVEVTVYGKVHLCDVRFYGGEFYESSYFTPGDSLVLWETAFGALGILICYDRHFPEAWRTLRAAGAEIVCVPIASPRQTEPTFVPEMQAAALQQGVFVVMANRAGSETLPNSGKTTHFLGQSAVIGPDGVVLAGAPADDHDLAIATDLNPEALERARTGLPLARHRRPETYRLDTVPMTGR